jgi:hypothetical protein
MTKKGYPRWRKFGGYSEVFHPYKGRLMYQVMRSDNHPDGPFTVCLKDRPMVRFHSMDEAKQFCEADYSTNHTRPKFAFPRLPIQRLERGIQKVALLCPVLNGWAHNGWLTVKWNPRFATVKWDYGAFDACWPASDRFKDMLQESNWDKELIRQLIEAGWNWHLIEQTSMRWNWLRDVPHQIAQWIIDTLPGVYAETVKRFNAESQKL